MRCQREGRCGPETSLWFLLKEWTRQGGQAEDWLVWIIPAGSGAQGLSLVFWYLPWVMRAGGQWPGVWEPHGGAGGGVGSGMAGLHWKGVLTGELFTISRN